MSEAWKYFEKVVNTETAKCKQCNATISCKGSSTSGMVKHLRIRHSISFQNAKANSSVLPSKKRKSSEASSSPSTSASSTGATNTGIAKYLKRQSLDEILARLVALDGFSPNAIAKSEFIRESVANRGYLLPKQSHTVMDHVHNFFDLARNEIIEHVQKVKAEHQKFSLTLDEWTSLRNRRYLNVNIHTNMVQFNLGLIRINGSCPSEEIERLTNVKLKEFNLSMNDIVAATTDGAAVMLKFGRAINALHQQCYNHGAHLAVIDVIFKKNAATDTEENVGTNIENNTADDDTNVVYSDDDCDDSDYENEDDDENEYTVYERADIHQTLLKVRKIVVFF